MNISKSAKISAEVFLTVILLALAAVLVYKRYSAEMLPITVSINEMKFDAGGVRCAEIPEIDGCRTYSYKGTDYMYKSYDSAADLDEALRSCVPDNFSGKIDLVIRSDEYLRLSYALDDPETGGTLNVTAYKYINSSGSVMNSLIFNNSSDAQYTVDKAQPEDKNSGQLTKFTERRREYTLGKTEKYKNALCVNFTETSESDDPLNNYVRSGYCMIILKDNVLYSVSGYDEKTSDEATDKLL